MTTETGTTPKHVFLYLLLIVMLYVSAISFIAVIFQYINILFPDPLVTYVTQFYDTIRMASSTLIVSFPVYLLMSWLIGKEYAKVPEARHMKTRKWLVYLTLFVAAITVIIDLVTLINSFYNGDLTTPFVLKVLTVLIVAVAVFGFHLWDLQKELPTILKKSIAGGVSVIILGTIIAGFFIAGSPMHQRDVRFDDQRVMDLQNAQGQIINYWQQKNVLPTTLEDLEDPITGYIVSTDPQTKAPYTYEKTGDLSFKLCATFATENNSANTQNYPTKYTYGFNPQAENWAHAAGAVCFDRTIDKELHSLQPTKQ